MVIERGADGNPVRLLATLADVQDRHDALERQRMSASLFQHLHEGLLITDAELRALDVNLAYTADPGRASRRTAGHRADAAAPDTGRPGGPPAARRHVGQPARHRQLARRVAGAAAQRRDVHAAGHHFHRARAGPGPALPRARHLRHHRAAPAAGATRAPGPLRRAHAAAQPIPAVATARRRHARRRPRRLPARSCATSTSTASSR